MDRLVYFTIRVRIAQAGTASQRVSGIIEDLASGQKHHFQNGDELLEIVGGGSDAGLPSPVQPEPGS